MAVYEADTQAVPLARKAGFLVNFAGGALSLGLMVGVGVWGYQLVMRDVTGIPVVRAMEGAMRVAPDNPGGQVALHTGLSVNTVAGEGGAAAPEDRLVLAPATTQLAEEDLIVQPTAEAGEVIATDAAPEAPEVEVAAALVEVSAEDDKPLETNDIMSLVDKLAAGSAPLTPLAAGEDVAPTVMLDGETVVASAAMVNTTRYAVTTSVRPSARPIKAVATQDDAAVAAAVAAVVNTTTLPVGTKLVQLGAFPNPEAAAQAWGRLQGKFAAHLAGKEQVIQEASRNGKAFYRLRASGFADLSEARRFCVTLEAKNADCIPVVVR